MEKKVTLVTLPGAKKYLGSRKILRGNGLSRKKVRHGREQGKEP